MALHDVVQPHIASFEHDGRKLSVTCRIVFDGIEYVGRLWFVEDGNTDAAIPDRGAFPGRSRDEVTALATRLTEPELALRFRRAQAERRRFHALRRATDDVLQKIRYLNQLSVSMRAGLLDREGAAKEVEVTEQQLHELVERLSVAAGVEGTK